MSMRPHFSIIICTLNREAVMCATLRKIAALLKGREDGELIVVDQTRKHNPETEQCLSELASVIQLHRVEFASLTKARNHAVRLAKGEIVLFLDDDVEPALGLIDGHLECYIKETVWGVAGCTLLPGKCKLSKQDFTPRELRALEVGSQNRFDLDWPRLTTWAPGCNMSFRKQKIFDIGGFDEAFYGMAIGEEAELCHRLRKAGGQIMYSPAAELLHLVNPEGGCRDARVEDERTAQLLDNAFYMLSHTGHSWFKKWAVLILQCKTIAFNRKSLFEWTWPSKLLSCFKGLRRALQGKQRKPILPLGIEDDVKMLPPGVR